MKMLLTLAALFAFGVPKSTAHEPPLRFDLAADPGASIELASEHPEVLRDIVAAAERQRATLQPAPTQLEAVIAVKPSAQADSEPNSFWKGTLADFQKLEAAAQEIDPQKLREGLLSAAIFHETNARRAELKLPVLALHDAVRVAALQHARAMAKGNYLSHGTPGQPQNSTPYDRLVALGLSPRFSAENVAFNFVLRYESGKPFYTREEGGRTVYSYEPDGAPLQRHSYASFAAAIVTQWMESPGHRKNIVAPEAEFLGVGCALSRDEKGFDKIYAGQNFYAALPDTPATPPSAVAQ